MIHFIETTTSVPPKVFHLSGLFSLETGLLNHVIYYLGFSAQKFEQQNSQWQNNVNSKVLIIFFLHSKRNIFLDQMQSSVNVQP